MGSTHVWQSLMTHKIFTPQSRLSLLLLRPPTTLSLLHHPTKTKGSLSLSSANVFRARWEPQTLCTTH